MELFLAVFVSNNILTPRIEMERFIEEEDVVVQEEPEEPEEEAPVLVAVVESVVESVAEVFEVIREQPEVQVAADVATPVVVASAVGGVTVLASSFSLLPFLQYLFTAPILFFARRRRQQFGLVYNAFTKLPVDLAIVRLYSMTGKLVRTMVTDQEGRYFFKTEAGEYRIEVTKTGFAFPSETLKGKERDGQFVDVYTGGEIKVTEKNTIISANIPVEPQQKGGVTTPRGLVLKRFLRVLQRMMGFSGFVLAIFVLIVQPSILTAGLFAFQFVILGVTLYLIKPKNKKGWGIVFEKAGEAPVKNVVVRLYEPKYNKLLESGITDGKGRYAFLAGANEYFVTYEKPGYAKAEVRPIDFTAKTEPSFISVDVGLKKA